MAREQAQGALAGLPQGNAVLKSSRAVTLGSHLEVHTARSRNSQLFAEK